MNALATGTPFFRKEVRKLKGYHLDRPAYQIKLNQNESPFDLPPALKKKVLARLEAASWNRYPTPFADSLREAIARREGVNTSEVLVANGSNVLIQALLLASAIRGKILTVSPGFSLYELEGLLLGNRVISVPLKNQDFSLPKDLILKSIRKAKPQVVFLANPNAPTGNLFPEETLEAVLKATPGLVVIDEAYYPFSDFTMKPYLKAFKNLVILRTLSKAFSLGGVRLGYLLADSEIVSQVMKVVLPFTVSLLSQVTVETVLEEDGYVQKVVKDIIAGREFLYQEMTKIPELRVYPSKANYILFQSDDASEIFQKLLTQGILIRDVSQKKLPNALRVTVGSQEENKKFLESLRKS